MKSTYIIYETESLSVIAKIFGEDDACHTVAFDRFEKELEKNALYQHEMIDIASWPPIDPDDEIDPNETDPEEIELYQKMLTDYRDAIDDGEVIDADLYVKSLSRKVS